MIVMVRSRDTIVHSIFQSIVNTAFQNYFWEFGDDNVCFFQSQAFRTIGVLMGVSIMQGGSGYPFFAPCVYDYLCGKQPWELNVSREEIPDTGIVSILENVLDSCSFT